MNFLGFDHTYKESKFIVVPVEYGDGVSLRRGTHLAPKRILKYSYHLDDFDTELGFCPSQAGIHTLHSLSKRKKEKTMPFFRRLQNKILSILKDGKIPVVIGGEHTISFPCVQTVKEYSAEEKFGVLIFDAHADMRNVYGGSEFSHACTVNLISKVTDNFLNIGVRSVSPEEIEKIRKNNLDKKFLFMEFLRSGGSIDKREIEKSIIKLPERVWISIDLDVLDPSCIPSVSTPEPGGFLFNEFIWILQLLCKKKKVIGFDVVELCPHRDLIHSEITTAKIIYKLIGFIQR